MKNNKLIMAMLLGLFIVSCEPLEDEIDAVNENFTYSKDVSYTLTEDDYEIADEVCDCSGFGNFSSQDDARNYVPVVLAEVFPAFGEGSSAVVTYDIYNGSSPDLRGTYAEYTVSTAEYDELGFSFGNFSDLKTDLVAYANLKQPEAEDGDYMDVTHDFYNGSFTENDIVSRVGYTVAYGWQYVWPIPDDAYGDFFGESGIDFSFEDEGRDKVGTYLNYLQKTSSDYDTQVAEEGDLWLIQYNFDDRDSGGNANEPRLLLFVFDGSEWVGYGDGYQTTASTLSFGHDGSVWVPDNTIKYSLTSADYSAIGTDYGDINPAGAGSALQYGNFDVSLWSSDQIFEAVTARLLQIPEIIKEEGQKYLVTYATWEPGAGSGTIKVIYQGDAFVEVE